MLIIVELIILTIFLIVSYSVFNNIAFNIENDSTVGLFFSISNILTISSNKKTISNFISYFKLEVCLLTRNKRTRGLIRVCTFLLLLAIPYITLHEFNTYLYLWYVIFIINCYSLILGQYMISLESSYFDFLISKNINYKNYFLAKFYVYSIFDIITFIVLTIVSFLLGKDTVPLIMILLYTLGINNILILYNSIFNNSKINLNEKSFNNWNGTRQNNFILGFIVMVIPMLYLYLIKIIISIDIALYTLGLIGFIFLVFHNKLIEYITIISKKTFIKKSELFHNNY